MRFEAPLTATSAETESRPSPATPRLQHPVSSGGSFDDKERSAGDLGRGITKNPAVRRDATVVLPLLLS